MSWSHRLLPLVYSWLYFNLKWATSDVCVHPKWDWKGFHFKPLFIQSVLGNGTAWMFGYDNFSNYSNWLKYVCCAVHEGPTGSTQAISTCYCHSQIISTWSHCVWESYSTKYSSYGNYLVSILTIIALCNFPVFFISDKH